MESSAEECARRRWLEQTAPVRPKGIWCRSRLGNRDVFFLCGTLGAEFDSWQRRLSATSAADALFSQQIGLAAVEKLMDELESQIRRRELPAGMKLLPRWSPGYGDKPLSLSRRILAELDAAKRIGVSITDSQLLVPSKSVTAVCEVVKE